MPCPERSIFRLRNIVAVVAALVIGLGAWLVFAAQTATPGNSDRYVEKFARHMAAAEPSGTAAATAGERTAWESAMKASRTERDIRKARDGTYGNSEFPMIDYYATYASPNSLNEWDELDYFEPFTAHEVVAHTLETMELVRSGGIYNLFERMATAPRIGRPPRDPPLFRLTDSETQLASSSLRRLARLNNARLELAARRGNWDEVVDAIRHGLALIRVDNSGADLYSYQSASGQLAMLAVRVQSVARRAPDAQTLERIRSTLESTTVPSLAHALEGERLIGLDLIERVYTDNGRGNGRFVPTAFEYHTWPSIAGPAPAPSPVARLKNLGGFIIISKGAAQDLLNTFFDGAIELADLTLPERQAAVFDPETFADELTWRELPLWLSTSGRVLIGSASISTMYLDAAHLSIALEMHRHRHGTYPASLEALVPEVLDSLPLDPANGATYGLRMIESSHEGKRYLLYSFGADGEDNGGIQAERPHHALRPGEAPGTDFVLMEWVVPE